MGMVNQGDAGVGIAAGTLIDGRYKVVRPIGQGGNGMVHEVEHLMTCLLYTSSTRPAPSTDYCVPRRRGYLVTRGRDSPSGTWSIAAEFMQ